MSEVDRADREQDDRAREGHARVAGPREPAYGRGGAVGRSASGWSIDRSASNPYGFPPCGFARVLGGPSWGQDRRPDDSRFGSRPCPQTAGVVTVRWVASDGRCAASVDESADGRACRCFRRRRVQPRSRQRRVPRCVRPDSSENRGGNRLRTSSGILNRSPAAARGRWPRTEQGEAASCPAALRSRDHDGNVGSRSGPCERVGSIKATGHPGGPMLEWVILDQQKTQLMTAFAAEDARAVGILGRPAAITAAPVPGPTASGPTARSLATTDDGSERPGGGRLDHHGSRPSESSPAPRVEQVQR